MKLTVSKKASDIQDQGNGGGFINKSGIYDVTLNYVQVATSKGGANQLNFNVTHNGQDQTIYGPYLTNKQGDINDITMGLLNRLCIVAGMADGQEIETETVDMPVGKDRKIVEMEVIPDLTELDLKMRVQMEYSIWDNNIQERKNIKAFYRADGATAAEAESGENIGRRIAIDEDKYANNVTYKDGLTEEAIQEWIKERSNNKGAPAKAAAPAAKTTAKRPLFGQK